MILTSGCSTCDHLLVDGGNSAGLNMLHGAVLNLIQGTTGGVHAIRCL